MWYIYCATNIKNNKSYIGLTTNLEKRKHQHIRDSKSNKRLFAFQNAINKYSKDSFTWTVIESHSTLEKANEAESFFIEYFQTRVPNGYNLVAGGFSHELHDTTKRKIGETLKKTSSLLEKKGPQHYMFGKQVPNSLKENSSIKLSGENGPQAKLKAEDAVLIYKLGLEGMNTSEIQKHINVPVGQNAILNILHRRSWKKQLELFPEIDFSKLSRRYDSKPKPIRRHKTKFTDEQIAIICSCQHTSSKLGEMFKVDSATIRKVRKRLCSKEQVASYKRALKLGLVSKNKK
jgi:group I intron endonuclease